MVKVLPNVSDASKNTENIAVPCWHNLAV